MILMLFWLTISTPFVWATQEELAKQHMTTADFSLDDAEDEDTSSGSNSIEEKVPAGSNLSEEFLHDHHTTDYFFSLISTFHKSEDADSYHAFHQQILVPPPNIA